MYFFRFRWDLVCVITFSRGLDKIPNIFLSFLTAMQLPLDNINIKTSMLENKTLDIILYQLAPHLKLVKHKVY